MTGQGESAQDRRLKGYWPHWLKRFWWDLLPGSLPDRFVPPRGGVVAPEFQPPEWLQEEFASTQQALEQARRAHGNALDRANQAEAKSNRLLQLCLALLALSVGLAGFELAISKAHPGGWATYLLLLPAGLAIVAFAAAAAIAAEGDRVGVYHMPGVSALARDSDPTRALVAAEERGRFLAAWTADKKLTDLMTARAWVTRGLVALLVAALIAVGLQLNGAPAASTSSSTHGVAGSPRAPTPPAHSP